MRNRGFLAGLIVGAIHFAFACSANAALLTFTDRSAWQVAALSLLGIATTRTIVTTSARA